MYRTLQISWLRKFFSKVLHLFRSLSDDRPISSCKTSSLQSTVGTAGTYWSYGLRYSAVESTTSLLLNVEIFTVVNENINSIFLHYLLLLFLLHLFPPPPLLIFSPVCHLALISFQFFSLHTPSNLTKLYISFQEVNTIQTRVSASLGHSCNSSISSTWLNIKERNIFMAVQLFGQRLLTSCHWHECRLSLVAVKSLSALYLFQMPAV